ncbi:hypothetical protein A2U01_0027878 [Trifolium medium]|uniref:Uncharacterized protein n=1 Tax=Trifolium medium TaxID=97028 RepID=A0A392P491_9FABA|nr:hypothetical protein [Trifolium medium]
MNSTDVLSIAKDARMINSNTLFQRERERERERGEGYCEREGRWLSPAATWWLDLRGKEKVFQWKDGEGTEK